jgi:hypothetical protein
MPKTVVYLEKTYPSIYTQFFDLKNSKKCLNILRYIFVKKATVLWMINLIFTVEHCIGLVYPWQNVYATRLCFLKIVVFSFLLKKVASYDLKFQFRDLTARDSHMNLFPYYLSYLCIDFFTICPPPPRGS